jgi:DNA-binding MarR family transcriptional regulator
MDSKQREETLTLELLQAIHEESHVTQRRLAQRLGVALGLANAYLKRCVRKGLVKIHQAPANRYLYYLTPKGFTEKSRLTASYLSISFAFYRRAGESFVAIFADCERRGRRRVALVGASELAEIAAVRALEHEVEIGCVLDRRARRERFLNLPLRRAPEDCGAVDAWLLTDLGDPPATYRWLVRRVGEDSVLVPDILDLKSTPGPVAAGAEGER